MRKFKTESKKLLDLMANSIYTNREIFLRELISNASDALDKLYIQSLTDKGIERSAFEIEVAYDEKARTVTVTDNGIGMDDDSLEKNLGTIAHSGSQEFEAEAEAGKDEIDIIGQFGVGFYSSFMVADKVTVTSRPYGSEQAWRWESDGVEGYTIKEAERNERGTEVVLHLRENTDDEDYDTFCTQYTLEKLIKRYSNYVRYPIMMEVSKQVEKPRPEDAGDDYKPEYETHTERQQINSMIPIWTRKQSEVSDEEYNEFYKSNFHDFRDPLRTISLHAEGTLEYDALLYIPTEPPMDMYSRDFEKGLALYSSNVMIMEECPDLLPDHFGFVRGVVDTKDLNLNISRETLQKDRQVQAIERHLEKRITSELEKMLADERDTYDEFFQKFGQSFKYGIYSSYGALTDSLADLLLFYSAAEEHDVTLKEYCEAAAADQKSIFFATGETIEMVAKTPSVQAVREKGYDVLLSTDGTDELCFMSMNKYDDKDFRNVAQGDLGIESESDKEAAKKANEENADLFSTVGDKLPDEVKEVIASPRLTGSDDAASCVTAAGQVSIAMAKYFASMPNNEGAPKFEYVLELNTHHKLFADLQDAVKAKDDEKVSQYATILLDQALIAEGIGVEDPTAFNEAINALIA
ncbi:MAG: molecular chaperone HtpG [Coriobacteriaceae bacterium]|nr:molecular chaperone HtpG [Coriobacteriaceae bacterium]